MKLKAEGHPFLPARRAGSARLDRGGAVSVEYALVAALVVLVAFGATYSGNVGVSLKSTFSTLASGV